MASELSESVWNKWTVTGDLRELIDAELQEVRDVLSRTQNQPHQRPPCWCRVKWPQDQEHDGPCKAARALWARLEIKQ